MTGSPPLSTMSGGSSILPKGAPEAALHDGDGRLDHLVTAENIGVVLDHTSLLNARKKAFDLNGFDCFTLSQTQDNYIVKTGGWDDSGIYCNIPIPTAITDPERDNILAGPFHDVPLRDRGPTNAHEFVWRVPRRLSRYHESEDQPSTGSDFLSTRTDGMPFNLPSIQKRRSFIAQILSEFSWSRFNGDVLIDDTPLGRRLSLDDDLATSLAGALSECTTIPCKPKLDLPRMPLRAGPVPPSTTVLEENWKSHMMSEIRDCFKKALVNFYDEVFYPMVKSLQEEGPRETCSGESNGQSLNAATERGCKRVSGGNKKKCGPGGYDDRGGGDSFDSDEDPSNPHPRKRRLVGNGSARQHRRLKCPFFARNINTFSHRCGRFGAFDINKVRAHLRKEHNECHCPTCFEVLVDGNGLSTVYDHPQPCRRRPQPLMVLTKSKLKELNAKEFRGTATQGDHWNWVFRMLFPGEEFIPDPFFSDGAEILSANFKWMMAKAGNQILNGIVARRRRESTLPLDETSLTMLMGQAANEAFEIIEQKHSIGMYMTPEPMPPEMDSTMFSLEMWFKHDRWQSGRPEEILRYKPVDNDAESHSHNELAHTVNMPVPKPELASPSLMLFPDNAGDTVNLLQADDVTEVNGPFTASCEVPLPLLQSEDHPETGWLDMKLEREQNAGPDLSVGFAAAPGEMNRLASPVNHFTSAFNNRPWAMPLDNIQDGAVFRDVHDDVDKLFSLFTKSNPSSGSSAPQSITSH